MGSQILSAGDTSAKLEQKLADVRQSSRLFLISMIGFCVIAGALLIGVVTMQYRMSERLTVVQIALHDVKRDVSELQKDVAVLPQIQQDIITLKQDIAVLRQDVSALHRN